MYIVVEARTQTVMAARPDGLMPWNRHGHREGYVEAPSLAAIDEQAAFGYTLLPPYAQAGGAHDPFTVVVGGDGTEYVSVHDYAGRHITVSAVIASPQGRVRLRQPCHVRGRREDGPDFVAFGGALYHRGSRFLLEVDPHFTGDGEAVIDVSVRAHRHYKAGILSFTPRQAHVIERIGRDLGLDIRTGSVGTAVGLEVRRPLGADSELPCLQGYVSRGMDLPVWRLNSKGLRAIADLRATHEEIHGGSTKAPLRELLNVMESVTGLNDPDNPVGPYEGDGWKWAMEEWSYEDSRAETIKECTEALRRRFVIERLRLAVEAEGAQPTSEAGE